MRKTNCSEKMSLATQILSQLDTAEAAALKAILQGQKCLKACHAARQLLQGVSEPSAIPKGSAALFNLPTIEEMKAKRKTLLNKKASAAANG